MATKEIGGGITLGLLAVIAIIICGAFLGYKGRETPAPAPTTDRPPIIVEQP